jgi:hypothetical protein
MPDGLCNLNNSPGFKGKMRLALRSRREIIRHLGKDSEFLFETWSADSRNLIRCLLPAGSGASVLPGRQVIIESGRVIHTIWG